MLKAILFDFSSTLVQAPVWMDLEIRSLPQQAFEMLADQGYISPLDPEALATAQAVFREARQTANTSLVETSHVDDLTAMVAVLELEQQVSPQVIEQTVAELHRRCVPSAELIDGAAGALNQLQARGYRLSVISNAAYSPFLTWTLDRFQILAAFEHVVVSADVRLRKPGLEIFRLTLDRMQLGPEHTAYVGDDYRKDVVASKELGMRSVWFKPGDPSEDGVDPSLPDVIVARLDQIPAWAVELERRALG